MALVRILVAFSQLRINAIGCFWKDRLLAFPDIKKESIVWVGVNGEGGVGGAAVISLCTGCILCN